MIVEQPTRHTVVCATDAIRKAHKQQTAVVVAETSTNTDPIVTASDTLCDEQSHDTIHFIQKQETPYYDRDNILPEKHIVNNTQKWSLGMAYAGSLNEKKYTTLVFRHGGKFIPKSDTLNITNHNMPISLSIVAHYNQNERWGIETGLNYIRLISELKQEVNGVTNYKSLQTIHYLGIPLKCTYTLCKGRKWSLYGDLGLTMGIPISLQINADAVTPNTKTCWLWSVGAGVGLQYKVTHNIGIFTEPSLLYYIPTQKALETYCTEHPFSFSLPLGIKFLW